jgi:hypothetical protein
MTHFASRVPFPLRMKMDKLGEKDPDFKRMVVGLDYAIEQGFSDTAIRVLIDQFLDYVEAKYFINRDVVNTRVVFFIADSRKKKRSA